MCRPGIRLLASTAAVCLCLFAVVCANAAQAQNAGPADSGQTSGSAADSSATAPNATQPAKKVWTNDDISDLRGTAPVSTVGAKPSKPAPKPAKAPAKPSANPYRAQIAKLQAQLPPIESQIADLQAALSGNTVDTPRKYIGVKPDDWHSELDELQKKQADILSQIDTLEEQARHAGVPTNALP
jgi:hypothetical protein